MSTPHKQTCLTEIQGVLKQFGFHPMHDHHAALDNTDNAYMTVAVTTDCKWEN